VFARLNVKRFELERCFAAKGARLYLACLVDIILAELYIYEMQRLEIQSEILSQMSKQGAPRHWLSDDARSLAWI
jgi:hypothetical protein